MRPRTICHPEALNDWRANDEAAPAYRWDNPYTFSGETNNASTCEHRTHYDKIPEEQKAAHRLLARRVKEAIEREIRRCRALREEGET